MLSMLAYNALAGMLCHGYVAGVVRSTFIAQRTSINSPETMQHSAYDKGGRTLLLPIE